MNATSTARVKVEAGGDQVVGHVGLHALGAFADRLGLGDALSAQIIAMHKRLPRHDRGKVLVHAMLMLAGGGECCVDIERLRIEPVLFGDVCSDSTLYRTLRSLDPRTVVAVKEAVAEVRETVWRRSAATKRGPVVLDLDGSLIDIHSENKEQTAPTYKGGFGFHPLACFADATGEMLAALLRPGNAGANAVADNLQVLDEGVAQLPATVRAGHGVGDDPGAVRRAVVARADSAGCTEGFVHGCRQRTIGFSVVARSNRQIHAAISRIAAKPRRWQPAITQDGDPREGAAVAEVTDLCDLSAWPSETRLIVRREPLHPGAQQTLFPSLDYRYWGFYTDQEGDPVELDRFMRAHAHVEDHIARLKDSGLQRFPFVSFEANCAWLAVVCFAADLVRWFQLLCLSGALAVAEPKGLRYRLWDAPGRVIRSARQTIVRVLSGWPDSDAILTAYRRLAAVT
ncbi:MAG TPA: IS1380 family transposase [Candidatus Dormibacteraeota bacterium]|nr:IS1380 family transposase [Candidatus Dormibacteraeota bacterium]